MAVALETWMGNALISDGVASKQTLGDDDVTRATPTPAHPGPPG
jgi:hypothetical protein